VTHNQYVATQNHTLKLLGKLINLAACSIQLKQLTIQEPYGTYNLRPQLHLFISAPFGELKSTMLGQISQSYPCQLYTHLTFPSLIGSIDRMTHQIIPAAAWEVRNRILLLDEFTATRASLVSETLLQLLENQSYSRKVATYSSDQEAVEDDLHFKVKSGTIEVKTRFSAIIATMKNIKKSHEYTFKALLSRTIPLRYEMKKDELDQVLDGKLLFKKEEYTIPSEVTIETEDYKHIRDVLDESTRRFKLERIATQGYARTVGDCCRVFALLGKHDEELYANILKLKACTIQSPQQEGDE